MGQGCGSQKSPVVQAVEDLGREFRCSIWYEFCVLHGTWLKIACITEIVLVAVSVSWLHRLHGFRAVTTFACTCI